jgi:hypothetical protein
MEVQWDKSVQGTLYVCLELSQWNLILLIYDNSKIK